MISWDIRSVALISYDIRILELASDWLIGLWAWERGLRLRTSCFYMTTKFKNVHHFFIYYWKFPVFQILIITTITSDNLQSYIFFSTRQKKKTAIHQNSHKTLYSRKILATKKGDFWLEIYKGVSRIYLNGGGFITFWPIGGVHIRRGTCLSGGANSRIYCSWGASWGSSINVILT